MFYQRLISLVTFENWYKKKIHTVGVDYLSFGGYEGNVIEVHQALLGSGIWAIEGLNLAEVEPGEHELICLPIKLKDGDGGLARAILRPVIRTAT